MKVLIVSGGSVNDTFALEWLRQNNYDLLIAADAGMNFLYQNGLTPDIIAGDFDSVEEEAYRHFIAGESEILRLNPVKDDTDTEFVIREAIRRGATEITILGATGTRLDHVLGNIHLLGIGLVHDVKIELLDAHNRIRMINSELAISKDGQFGKYVSILPFAGDAKGVTLKGFKYPLEDYTIESFCSLGISNEIIEEVATVRVKEGVLVVIESRD